LLTNKAASSKTHPLARGLIFLGVFPLRVDNQNPSDILNGFPITHWGLLWKKIFGRVSTFNQDTCLYANHQSTDSTSAKEETQVLQISGFGQMPTKARRLLASSDHDS